MLARYRHSYLAALVFFRWLTRATIDDIIYFVSENHVLPRIAGSSMGVVRDDGSAGRFSFFRTE